MARRGPKTDRGKAVVRLNAVRHGVLSVTPVIPVLESEEDWQAHRAALLASLAPEGHLEQILAERAALVLWRLQRLARYEREVIIAAQSFVPDDVGDAVRYSRAALGEEVTESEIMDRVDRLLLQRLVPDEASLNKIMRYEAHLNRQLYQALHELEALKARRQGQAAPLARVDVHGLPQS